MSLENETGITSESHRGDEAYGESSSPEEHQSDASPSDVSSDVPSDVEEEHAEGSEPPSADGTRPAGKKMRWYVVQAYSGYENKVKASLEERIRQYSMQEQFGEILIPREQVTETRGTAKRVTSRTFYPGYMFVQMNLTDESWHLVKDTPKVSGFVGGRYPTAVPASQINLVAQQVAEGAAKPKPRVVFEQGDHVRVIEGAFANFTGTIEEVKPEKQKVRVLVSIFGRATPVELDYSQVEKTV